MKSIFNFKLSGQAHHAWRQSIADQAARFAGMPSSAGQTTHTVKYPLDLEHAVLPDREKLINTYNVINGKEKGSLFHFLMTLHLSGFDLFSSKSAAELALNSDVVKDYSITLPDADGELIKGEFSCNSVLKAFFRGRPPEYDLFIKMLYDALAPKDKLKNAQDCKYPSLYTAIQTGFSAVYDTVELKSSKDVLANLNQITEILDAHLKRNNIEMVSLNSVVKKLKPAQYPAPILYHGNGITIKPTATPIQLLCAVIMDKAHRHNVFGEGVRPGPKLQELITTPNADALSWLFNGGLKLFKNKKDTSEAFPDITVQQVEQLHAAASALPSNLLFGASKYELYRNNIQGELDGWLANFANRISVIKSRIDELEKFEVPPEFFDDENKTLFSGTIYTPATLQASIAQLKVFSQEATLAINSLIGQGESIVDPHAPLDTFIGYFNGFVRVFSALANNVTTNLRMATKAKDLGRVDELTALSEQLVVPKKIDKLLGIGGGMPSEEDIRISGPLEEYNRITNAISTLIGALPTDMNLAVERQMAVNKGYYAKRKQTLDESQANNLARRHLLQLVLKTIRAFGGERSSKLGVDAVRKLNLFTSNKRDLNVFFFEKKGDVYFSPHGKKDRQPYRLNISVLDSLNLHTFVAELVSQLRQLDDPSIVEFKDLIELEQVQTMLAVKSLRTYPDPRAIIQQLEIELDPALEAALQNELTSEVMSRVIKSLYSHRFACINQLFRPSFKLKMPIKRKGFDTLYYQPKPKPFKLHDNLLKAESSTLGSGFKALGLTSTDNALEAISADFPVKKKTKVSESGIGSALSHIPHNWYVSLDFDGAPIKEQFFVPMTNKYVVRPVSELKNPARLAGVSSMRKPLNQMLQGQDVKLGEYDFLFELNFKNTLRIENGRILSADTELDSTQVFLSVPITQNNLHKQTMTFGDVALGIDLNERGIGFGVVSLRSDDYGEVLGSGTVPIPSLKQFISQVERFHARHQANQRFNQKNNDFGQTKKRVVGNVCHVIDSLLNKYNAIPVFESSVKSFDIGKNQLSSVYESVTNLYTYSDVSQHGADKAHYWKGAKFWYHPTLLTSEYDAKGKKKEGKTKPLPLHPGVAINPAGTSQMCHACGANPMKDVYEHVTDKEVVELDALGVFSLNGTSYQLKKRDPAIVDAYRRINRNAPFTLPFSKGQFKKAELIKIVKRQLRQPNEDKRSKDSSQAIYHCMNVECGKVIHADENAGINIAKKLLEKLV